MRSEIHDHHKKKDSEDDEEEPAEDLDDAETYPAYRNLDDPSEDLEDATEAEVLSRFEHSYWITFILGGCAAHQLWMACGGTLSYANHAGVAMACVCLIVHRIVRAFP